MPQYRRKQYLVNRRFQLKYTLAIMLVGGVIAAIFGGWMWQAHKTNTEMLALDEAFHAELMAQDQHILLIYVGVTLLMIASLGLLGILMTHRVAGPTYVINRYLQAIAEGAYPSLRPLRRKDELKELFESLEGAVEALRTRDREEAEVIEAALEKLQGDEAAIDALRKICERKRQSAAGAAL
ncbi:MAG: hypothetical protein D6729_12670 [Deltaproteobacteria bacterium]|nr:MAG: hypothetical protein D6729_12670 [Deltaproteobacteria bacterium]